jgi:hypothetical protein
MALGIACACSLPGRSCGERMDTRPINKAMHAANIATLILRTSLRRA